MGEAGIALIAPRTRLRRCPDCPADEAAALVARRDVPSILCDTREVSV